MRKTLVGASLAILVAGVSQGSIIIQTGNNPQPPEENILFNQTGLISTGTTVQGVTNQSSAIVNFTGTETLATPSLGQARVEAVDGAFTNLTIGLATMDTFGDLIFNLNSPNNVPGTVTITANPFLGSSVSSTFNLGNGSNFFTVFGDDGETFTTLGISSSIGLLDIRQVRISGLAGGGGPGEVPEPATYALLGSGLILCGLLGRRRRRTS